MDSELLLAKARSIVSEEWGDLVKKYQLRPGSISEEFASRIMVRLHELAEEKGDVNVRN